MSTQVKYKEIYQELMRDIAEGVLAGGEKLPSEQQLARRFGVTRQTVLKALNILKIQGSLRSEQGRGTFVTAPFKRAKSNSGRQLAFIASNLQDSFACRALLGIESAAHKAGFSLVTCNTRNDPEREAEYLRRARDTGIDGVILVPYFQHNRELAVRISRDLPLVCLDNGFDDCSIPVVTLDHFKASRDAVEALIVRGHRRIGFILSTFAAVDKVESVRLRFEGYKAALTDARIALDESLVVELGAALANMRPRDVGLELYGYPAMHRLMCAPQPPTAVVLLWDELAPGAYAAIRDAHRCVARDFSLVGFNDDELCTLLAPRLSSVRQDGEAMGAVAVRLLFDSIAGNAPPPVTMVEGELIIRESVSEPFEILNQQGDEK